MTRDELFEKGRIILGITDQEIRDLTSIPTHDNLRNFKARARKAYRKAALLIHPDRPGGSEEEFKIASLTMELIDKMKIRPAPVRHYPVLVVRTYWSSAMGGTSWTSTTDTTTTGHWP